MKRKVTFHDGFNGSGGDPFFLELVVKENPSQSPSDFVRFTVYYDDYGQLNSRGNLEYEYVVDVYSGGSNILSNTYENEESINLHNHIDEVVDALN